MASLIVGHVVRRVLHTEYYKYLEHLKRLDSTSRYLRFTGTVSDSGIEQFYNTVANNKSNHILFCIENEKLEFVAVGHISIGNTVEVAFSVEKNYQHTGMGTALLKRVMTFCRVHNLLKGHMTCLPTNSAIKQICIKNNIPIHNEHGEVVGDFALENANITTFIIETANVNLSMLDFMAKRLLLPFKENIVK